MGAGASAGIVTQVNTASQEEVDAVISQVNAEAKQKLKTALESPSSGDATETCRTVTFLHFNDVYRILPKKKGREPAGGLARMATLIESHKSKNPILTMGGDFMSPSVMSGITKGSHMIEAFNLLGVQYGVFGNHEFDFGLETLQNRIEGQADLDDDGKADNPPSTTKWLLSNVVDSETGQPPCGAVESVLLEHQGVKVGLLGLCEDWISLLGKVPPGRLQYKDMFEVGNNLVAKLRGEGAELIVALTHNRLPMDRELAEKCQGIDLLLGGHDHFPDCFRSGAVTCIKTGVDFQELAVITVEVPRGGRRARVQWPIPTEETRQSVAEHAGAKALCDRYNDVVKERMGKVLCHCDSDDLDTSESLVRLKECAAGNLFADIFRTEMDAQVSFLNGGGLRGGMKFPKGPFTKGDVYKIFPFDGQVLKVKVTGDDLWLLLENGVSKLPNEDGRFPHISGMSFGYRPSSKKDERVQWVKVGDKDVPRDSAEEFTMAVGSFLASGREGADCLEDATQLVDEEFAPQTQTCVIHGLINLCKDGHFTCPPVEGRHNVMD